MSKRPIIRIGDRIKVTNPLFVERVGYPLVWTDLIDEVKKDPRTLKAWRLLTEQPEPLNPTLSELFTCVAVNEVDNIPKDFIRVIAYQRVLERRHGGPHRKLIYFKENPAGVFWRESVFTVIGKKVAKTGKYVPPHSYGIGDYEPGRLDDCETHILLQTHAGWIEATNVELIEPATSKISHKSKAHLNQVTLQLEEVTSSLRLI